MPPCMRSNRQSQPTVSVKKILEIINLNIMSTALKPTRVILVRHGQSTYNAEKRYQGSSDASCLTELGQQQAEKVAQLVQALCAETPIAAVYVSPLKRTQQTAQSILNQLPQSIPIVLHEDLREIDLPDWEGLTFAQVQTEFAADYQTWINTPKIFQTTPSQSHGPIELAPKPNYPVQDLYKRAQRFWRTVLPQHQGQTILIVSHGGTIRALTSNALGIPIEQFHYLQQSNAGVTTIEFDPFGKATLRGMNQTHHLGEVLPKPKHGKQGLRLILVPGDQLNNTADQAIAHLFQSTSISFSLSSSVAASRHARQILQHHPQTMHFETGQENFLLQWQQLILDQRDRLYSHDPKTPTNALIVAPSKSLQTLLSKLLQLPEPDTITIQKNTFSSIFYPAKFQHPVLQGLNIPVISASPIAQSSPMNQSSPRTQPSPITQATTAA
jgi:phosphoserine phosphatase